MGCEGKTSGDDGIGSVTLDPISIDARLSADGVCLAIPQQEKRMKLHSVDVVFRYRFKSTVRKPSVVKSRQGPLDDCKLHNCGK